MVQSVGAFFLIFVVLLVLLNLSHHAREDVLTIQNDHASLLKVSRARHNHAFIHFYLPQLVCILLQKYFLVWQIFVCLFNELLQLYFVAFYGQFRRLVFLFIISHGVSAFIWLFALFVLKQRLDLEERLHFVIGQGSLRSPAGAPGILRSKLILP